MDIIEKRSLTAATVNDMGVRADSTRVHNGILSAVGRDTLAGQAKEGIDRAGQGKHKGRNLNDSREDGRHLEVLSGRLDYR